MAGIHWADNWLPTSHRSVFLCPNYCFPPVKFNRIHIAQTQGFSWKFPPYETRANCAWRPIVLRRYVGTSNYQKTSKQTHEKILFCKVTPANHHRRCALIFVVVAWCPIVLRRFFNREHPLSSSKQTHEKFLFCIFPLIVHHNCALILVVVDWCPIVLRRSFILEYSRNISKQTREKFIFDKLPCADRHNPTLSFRCDSLVPYSAQTRLQFTIRDKRR